MSGTHLLSRFDLLCLGTNAIVGSGIYAFPGLLAQRLGPASVLAFALCGLMSALVALCFAEVAGMFDRSGGPYVYAQAAFGRLVGYLVGWTCWVAAVTSWAAVTRALVPYAGHLWAPLGSGAGGTAMAVGLTLLLGVINYRGIKLAAYTTDILTVAKLAPLLLLVGVGVVSPRRARGPFAPHGLAALPSSTLAAFFAFQGFEVVPVPAGETANPERNVPLAVLGSLLLATLLYVAVQWVAVSTTPEVAGADEPLAVVGRALLGATGGQIVAGAAVVSMLGFCAGVALAGPRYLEPLCTDGHLPSSIARRHPRFGTPHVAIAITCVATALLVLGLSFGELVNLSVLAVGAQYLVTCLAVPVLRRRRPTATRPFRVRGGPVVPALATLVVVWLAAQASARELASFAAVVTVGLVLHLLQRRRGGCV